MHQMYAIIDKVNSTHLGLGSAVAFSIICVKAHMCMLLIAPSGTGKSVITDMVARVHPNPKLLCTPLLQLCFR